MIYVPKTRTWGKSYYKLINQLDGYLCNEEDAEIILCFGYCYNPSAILLNKNSEIMSNKILMNKTLDKLHIPHPKTYYYPFNNIPKTNEECVIKKQYSHKGKDVRFSTFNRANEYNLQSNDYIQYYIPFEKEYRVCVDWYGVLGIREKCGNYKIRNSLTCTYETRDIPELRDFALDVYNKMKVDFTGMDIGIWNKTFIVIELNSSPTIGDYWAKLLSRDLIMLSQDKIKQDEIKRR